MATRRDVDVIRLEIERLGDRLRAEWRRELLGQTLALLGANAGLAAIVFAAARLT